MVFAVGVTIAVSVRIVLADADRRHHALALADTDDAHAPRAPSRNADSVDRTADQGATVGDQHDLVAVADRKRRDDFAASGQTHELDAFAAAAGDPVFVGRCALAEAGRGDGEDELLLGFQLLEALARERG